MANYYVWSGATGGATGADWANAYTTLISALTGKAAGDVFFVAHDHADTSASLTTLPSPGTELNAAKIFCVNRAGSVPPVAADLRTTATVTTTGASSIQFTGSVSECYGITFSCSTGATTTNLNIGTTIARSWKYVGCKFIIGNTAPASRVAIGATANQTVLENCTFQFGDVGQSISTTSRVTFRNTVAGLLVQGATIPTALFIPNGASTCFLEGVDLSASGSGKSIVSMTPSQTTSIVLKDCKLDPSVAILTGTSLGAGGVSVTLIRTDSGDTNYRSEHHSMMGSQTTETTIVRTGGASDGVTSIAWKITTPSTTNAVHPFDCLPISTWNEAIGSPITVTIEGIWGAGAVPTNADIWIDVEYLGTSGLPLGNRATSGRAGQLETATNIPAGAGTWGGSTTKFAMSVTITPQEKGPITIYVRTIKSASTFYIDPKPVIS